MEIRSVADELWFSTAHLECRGSKGISTGTGFFYAVHVERPATGETGPVWFLITNRHVVEGAQHRMDIGLIQAEAQDGKFSRPLLGRRVGIKLTDPEAAFFFHPDDTIDVAILPFNQYMDQLVEGGGPPMLISVGSDQMLTDTVAEQLDSMEQIVVMGYPDGLYDRHNLTPIARTGHTATPIRLDYGGEPTFLVDAPIFPGSSGSPVFLVERLGMVTGAVGATGKVILLGVVAAAHLRKGTGRDKRLMDLGIVYKARAIDECVDTAFSCEGINRLDAPAGEG